MEIQKVMGINIFTSASSFGILNRLPFDKKNGKRVVQLYKNGDFVRSFKNVQQAAEYTGIKKKNILKCCQGKINTAGGFKWEFQKMKGVALSD